MNACERHGQTPAPDIEITLPAALLTLALLPALPFILILRELRRRFTDLLRCFKRNRASIIARHRGDYLNHYEGLRRDEWLVLDLLTRGAQQILCEGRLDLEALGDVSPIPDDWHCPIPTRAEAMHKRFERVTQIMADPAAAIRRHLFGLLTRGKRARINATFAARLIKALRHVTNLIDNSNPGVTPKRAALRPP